MRRAMTVLRALPSPRAAAVCCAFIARLAWTWRSRES